MAWLIRKNLSGVEVERWGLGESELIVGRGDQAHARTTDGEMSRQHFKIRFKDRKHFVQDLKSHNGTKLNGQPVTEAELKPNDEIRAGESIFEFTLQGTPEVIPTITGVHKPKGLKQT